MKTIKITTTLLFILMACIWSFAQPSTENFNIKWGKEAKAPGKWERINKIIGADENKVYALRTEYLGTLFLNGKKKDQIYLESISKKSMNVLKSVEVEMKYNSQNLQYVDILESGDELILFTAYMDKKEGVAKLLGQKVSKTTLAPQKKHIEIAEVKVDSKVKGNFLLRQSEDKLAFGVTFLTYSKGLQLNFDQEYHFIAFNSNLEKLWEKHTDFDNLNVANIDEMVLDNVGNIFVGFSTEFNRKSNTRDYFLHQLSQEIKKVHPLSIEEEQIMTINLVPKENYVYSVGLSKSIGAEDHNSCYSIQFDTHANEILKTSSAPFNADILLIGLDKTKADKLKNNLKKLKKEGIAGFFSESIVMKKDGGFFIVAEHLDFSTHFATNPNLSMDRTEYIYNDLLLVEYAPNGEILNTSKIPKRQRGAAKNYLSYTLFMAKDNPHFIMNNTPYFGRGGEKLLLKGLNEGREAYTNEIGDISSMKMLPCPQISKQTGPNEIILYAEYTDKYRFGILTYTE